MPRIRADDAPAVVYRVARRGLRATPAQARRLWALLVAGGDLWACVLELNGLRRQRGDLALVSYQGLCRELARSGPGTFGELDATGARSVLRRYSDAWFAAAKARRGGDLSARYPRRKRRLVALRWYAGTFSLRGQRLRIPTAVGAPPLWVRLCGPVPYPPEQVRSVTLIADAGRLWVEVCAEVPVRVYPPGEEPDPARAAGVDLGIIHPYALAGPDGQGLLVSGRALRAESRLHLAERKARSRAVAARAPTRGQRGSRRWRKFRARTRQLEARHRRRLAQARHEAARHVIDWAVEHRVGTLVVGDPVGVLDLDAGGRHNQRVRDWRPAQLSAVLADKAALAAITVHTVNERGTSSTCPRCARPAPKPAGRTFRCPHCGLLAHRDLVGATNIAARNPGGGTAAVSVPETVTHRRGGRHLPGAGRSRRDPRRTRWSTRRALRRPWPAAARPTQPPGSRSTVTQTIEDPSPNTQPGKR
jgi:IS605 OrfB family transposase